VPLSSASRGAAPAPDSRSWAAAVFRAVTSFTFGDVCVCDLVQGTRTSSSKPLSTCVDSVGARPRAKTLPRQRKSEPGSRKTRRTPGGLEGWLHRGPLRGRQGKGEVSGLPPTRRGRTTRPDLWPGAIVHSLPRGLRGLRRRVSEPVEDQELPEEPAFDLPPFVELAGVIIDRHE
jgi:hypothetical protein